MSIRPPLGSPVVIIFTTIMVLMSFMVASMINKWENKDAWDRYTQTNNLKSRFASLQQFDSSDHQPNEGNDQYYKMENLKETRSITNATWFGAWFGGVALILSMAAIGFSIWQFFASSAQSRQTLRAYVFPVSEKSEFEFQEGIKGNKILDVIMEFKNFGQTPAYSVSARIRVAFDDPKNPTKLSVDKLHSDANDNSGKETIGPGASVTSRVTIGYPSSSHEAWERGEQTIYVYGAAVFRDAFERYWRSDIRLKLIFDKDYGPEWFACDSGNEEKRYYPT